MATGLHPCWYTLGVTIDSSTLVTSCLVVGALAAAAGLLAVLETGPVRIISHDASSQEHVN